MVGGAGPGTVPMELAIGFLDREVVDASVPLLHQSVIAELPVLVAIRPKPVAGIVMAFVSEAYRDPVAGEGPKLLDETVVELSRPLASQECDDLGTAVNELGAVS